MGAAHIIKLRLCIMLLAALFFLVMGIAGLLAPAFVARQFQVKDLTITGRNEVRAVYGGFGVATAGALVYAVFDTDARNGITLAVTAALFGMAAGRVFSAIVDRSIGRFALVFLLTECVLAACLLAARG